MPMMVIWRVIGVSWMARNATSVIILLLFGIISQTYCQEKGKQMYNEFEHSVFQGASVLKRLSEIDMSDFTAEEKKFVELCQTGDADAIYAAARDIGKEKSVLLGKQDIEFSLSLYAFAADALDHPPSQGKLGKLFEQGVPPHLKRSTSAALHYYQKAGEHGHHSSLYNAGRLLARGMTEEDAAAIQSGEARPADFISVDLVGAMAYLQAAATLHMHYPEDTDESLTPLSIQSHGVVSASAAHADLTLRQMADAFIFGTLSEVNDNVDELWRDAVDHLIKFNDTFVATEGRVQDPVHMKGAAKFLHEIVHKHSDSLSSLQLYLALDNLNDMLGPLSGLDESYLPDAAKYALQLSSIELCMERYAATESDPACFNGAISAAVSYHRRAGDQDGATESWKVGKSHPNAATHWKTVLQTPRVYHENLTAKPWWDSSQFSAPSTLKALYENDVTRSQILKELDGVVRLQEGSLRMEEVILNTEGESPTRAVPSTEGLQRIFTPYIGIKNANAATAQEGAGGWSEFGPLFDGVNWSRERCAVVPTICDALRGDKSLCSERDISSENAAFVNSQAKKSTIWELCGSGTVVTILRLRPGTSILPHCGTTNARLIMHFPLIGSEGVKFVVGDETVMSYGGGDGHPIVFDDSFEHHVYHEGTEDRFVVLAVLGHPDLMK
mmetsp:Transcript_10302/g.14401  ORF Transcript_10302/g.14401 Transcript_10302/m.14401 type:complete len:670 (-) Transcript_10302:129-2138(-)